MGSEFVLELRASDPDLDELRFFFDSELSDIKGRAQLSLYGAGVARFRWTPLASDIGTWAFDFSVSDGSHTTTETITIDVRSSVGANNAPSFRSPLGTGTTLDLSQRSCLDVSVVVEDPDTPDVVIGHEEPAIEGSELTQHTGLTGTWSWCPSRAQIDADDRYLVTLSADDRDNPKTLKHYLIVLRKQPKPDCPGDPPVVTHTPMDQSTVVSVNLTAQISDDMGLKREPLLYYSTTAPSSPPDLSAMTQLTMSLQSGDMRSGTWKVSVPNPTAGMPAGTSANLYYVIVADDNDDTAGDCDHVTQAPSSGTYQMRVTNPGGSGGLAHCEACTSDSQCGGSGDNCLRMGSMGEYFCFTGCTMPGSDAECPDGYYCSYTMFTSIDGATAHQCIPDSLSCEAPAPMCVDDSYEENDTLSQASSKPALLPGSYSSLKSCPGTSGDDEDFYKITISADSQITASISGGSATDLDLALLDSTGTVLTKSDSLSSNEMVSRCLTPGTYYLRVYAWGSGENTYSLTYSRTAQSCGGACVDDANEDDDDAGQARMVDLNLGAYRSMSQQICSMDEDWYDVYMYAGETLHVTLAFTQTSTAEDLDVLLYQGTTLLTQCTETDASGCSSNGQSTNSNENFTYSIATTGTYYVVARGWNGAQNTYDICIGLSTTDCPAL